MTKFYLTISLLLVINLAFGARINFITNFNEALKLAKEQNKFIFVDVMADWCGPCKIMIRDIENNEDVVQFFNDNFINLQINEKQNGPFLSKFWIKSLPTVVFLNLDGEEVDRLVGYRGLDILLNTAKSINKSKSLHNFIIDGDSVYDEQAFVNKVSNDIASLSVDQQKSYTKKVISLGLPYSRTCLVNFESCVDYSDFTLEYQKINGKSDLLLTEKLLVSHLFTDPEFKTNDMIRKKSKQLTEMTGLEQNKMIAYVLAYKELNINKQLGLSTDQSLLIYSKNLLKYYPETKDIELLYNTFTEVLKLEKDIAFYTSLEQELYPHAIDENHYLYYDILSVIHFIMDKKEDCAKDIAKANDLASNVGVKYVPLFKSYRTYLKSIGQ